MGMRPFRIFDDEEWIRKMNHSNASDVMMCHVNNPLLAAESTIVGIVNWMLNVWTVCWDVVSHDNTWTLAVVSCGVFSLLADDHCLVTSFKYCVAFRHVNYLVSRQSVLSCHDIRFNQGRRRIPRSCGLKGHWCLVCTCHAAVMSCCQSVLHTTRACGPRRSNQKFGL